MPSSSSIYGSKSASIGKNKSASTSLAFSTSFSSLLAASVVNSASTSSNRPRPSKDRTDSIFTVHNKDAKKRALADVADEPQPQKHARTSEAVDASTWQRSKRKMEEKARLYASMKRGDYVPPGDGGRDRESEGLVDFDRKWADKEDAQEQGTSSDEYDVDSEGGATQELVEYEDEYGRLRKGTKAEIDRERRRRNAENHAREELANSRARPERPNNLILGDTVQAAAFNPDEPIAARMDDLARKRDRSMTPPEETHYDATKEIRTKGVGFFQFSKDNPQREREMEDLERERAETEKSRLQREERKQARLKKLEERKTMIGEKRGEKLAERFLDGLDV